MNLKDPLWSKKGPPNSAPGVANGSTIANIVDSPSNNTSLFSTNETDYVINAITGSGTHLWSFEDYWIITLPVVAATIFLPIIVGPVFRYSIRNLLKNTAFIVPILMLLTIVASISTSLKDKFRVHGCGPFPLWLDGCSALGICINGWKGPNSVVWVCHYVWNESLDRYVRGRLQDHRYAERTMGIRLNPINIPAHHPLWD